MGSAELREIAVRSEVSLADLRGATAAVDAFNWLYRYMTTTVRNTDPADYTTSDGTEVPNLLGILDGLPRFFERGLFPVFVFDGSPVKLKEKTLRTRRRHRKAAEQKAAAARKRGDTHDVARYKSRTIRITKPIRQTSERLFELLDIPFLTAPSEAEAQAAFMARAGTVDYSLTDDFDALLYGTPLTLREWATESPPECMDFQATLDRHGLTWRQLVDVAILCGTDYNDGVPNFGPKRALAEITAYGDLESVLERVDATVEHADQIRELFVHPAVDDDYTFERQCTPALDTARTFLVDEWELPAAAVDSRLTRLAEYSEVWA